MKLSITAMLEVSPNLLLAVTGKKKNGCFLKHTLKCFFKKNDKLLQISNWYESTKLQVTDFNAIWHKVILFYSKKKSSHWLKAWNQD